MTQIKTIYVDMDGVLCDFQKRFTEKYDPPPPEGYYTSNTKKRKTYKANFDAFVKARDFATLDPLPDLPDGRTIIGSLERKYKVKILSSTADMDHHAYIQEQKRQWLAERDIQYEAIFVPGKRFKKNYATPEAVLIDDNEENIMDWISAGGIGILHVDWGNTACHLYNLRLLELP